MKILLKKILPASWWENLRYLKKWRLRKPRDFFRYNPFDTAWTFCRVARKHSATIVKQLDYRNASIFLEINAPSELQRLNACRKEPETVRWIETRMQPGHVFYDIGANVGAYALIAASVAKKNCTVYAFEPSFSTFDSLVKNIVRNGMTREVIPFQIALAERTALAAFHYSSMAPGTAGHAFAGNGNAPAECMQTLPAYRLDDLIRTFSLRIPTHIKLDVDGAEYQVLLGAQETLKRREVRSLLVEINETLDTDRRIAPFLTDRGFALKEKHSRSRSKVVFNCIFEKEPA